MTVPDRQKGDCEEKALGPAVALLTLRDFRNYESASVAPGPHLNVVCGPNAQGKTSLLEAVSLVSTGRLLRASRDSVAIRHGAESARVTAQMAGTGTSISVELRQGVRKRVELNGVALPRASDILGRLPSVSFSTPDLATVTGEPSDRRQFMDLELAQLYPSYLRHLSVYKRALEQRNALLRLAQEAPVSASEFESWEAPLAEGGAALRTARHAWVRQLAQHAAASHREMGSGEPLTLSYEVRDEGDEPKRLLQMLAESRAADVRRGSTSCGPHRDDLAVMVEGVEARHFASQGQQRTAVIALKLAVLACAEDVLGCHPVLLLDDVFSDLDATRRLRLMALTLDRGAQVFLTCTEPELAGEALLASAQVFRVDSGRITSP